MGGLFDWLMQKYGNNGAAGSEGMLATGAGQGQGTLASGYEGQGGVLEGQQGILQGQGSSMNGQGPQLSMGNLYSASSPQPQQEEQVSPLAQALLGSLMSSNHQQPRKHLINIGSIIKSYLGGGGMGGGGAGGGVGGGAGGV